MGVQDEERGRASGGGSRRSVLAPLQLHVGAKDANWVRVAQMHGLVEQAAQQVYVIIGHDERRVGNTSVWSLVQLWRLLASADASGDCKDYEGEEDEDEEQGVEKARGFDGAVELQLAIVRR